MEKLKVELAESLAQRQQVAAKQKVHLHREVFRTAGRASRPNPQAMGASKRLLGKEVSPCPCSCPFPPSTQCALPDFL